MRRQEVYGNLMVDVQATSEQLLARSRRIATLAARGAAAIAAVQLVRCNREVQTTIVAPLRQHETAMPRALLQRHDGSVRAALAATAT